MYYQPQLDFKPDEVLVYLRKSRSDDPLLSVEEVLAKHETILDEWAEKYLDGKVPEGNKFREVISGETIDDRPEVQKVLKLIESPKYKAVLIVEVQRLSRGDLEDAGRLIKLLRYTNTLVITPPKTYDLSNEYDRDMFERELKRGNEFLEYQKKIMNRGRLLSVSQGNYLGNRPPYGYDKVWVMDGKKKCPTLQENKEQADVVRMIFDMYVNQDMGRPSICYRLDELGIKPPKGERWSPHALKDLLENVHYIGKVKWNWRKTVKIIEDSEVVTTRPKSKIGEYLIYDGKHEAIISEELFMQAREKQEKNHRAKPNTKVRNPLAGLVYCQCGRAMSLRIYKKRDGSQRSPSRILCDNQAICKTSSALYSEMIEKVCDILKECIQDFEMRIQNDDKDSQKLHDNLIKRLKAKQEELNKKEISQWEKYTEEGMPKHIFDKLNEKVLKEKEEVHQALCKAYESMPAPVDYEERLIRFRDALDTLQNPEAPAELQNKLLKACIERIDYNRGKAVRTPSQQICYYDKELKKTRYKSPLNTGGNWTSPPIELDVKLKLDAK